MKPKINWYYTIGVISFVITGIWTFGIALILMPGPGQYLDPELATKLLQPVTFIIIPEILLVMIGLIRGDNPKKVERGSEGGKIDG